MNKEVLFLESSKNHKKGTILENFHPTVNGILDEGGNFIEKKNFIYLTEKLSKEDENKVREMIKEMLRLFLWRLYTRNSLLTQ